MRQIRKAGEPQVSDLAIPNDNMIRAETCRQQALNDRRHNGWPGSTIRAGRGEHFDADDILRGKQTAPGLANRRFLSKIRNRAIDHASDHLSSGFESFGGSRIFDDDDAGAWFWLVVREGLAGLTAKRKCGQTPACQQGKFLCLKKIH